MRTFILIILFNFLSLTAYAADSIQISPQDALKIGVKIWYNESSGSISGLTSWSQGESFASLGIGHFIWYPNTQYRPYSESFPQLLKYMEKRGVIVPQWLRQNWAPFCPWNNRQEFLAAQHSQRMIQLRQFLVDTIPLQAEFMIYRMENALPKMLASVPAAERPYIRWQFYRLAQTPLGVYALVDYVNFKGIGVSTHETYDAKGWGLLEVLEQMKYAPNYMNPSQAFAWAADQILTRRVLSEPPYRHDWVWLSGWRNRLKTYLD